MAILLIALMAVGSVMLWLGIPFAWIWLASHLQKGQQPSMGPYLLILFGIPISMVAMGRILTRLNRAYGEVTETTAEVRFRAPWMRSMRGERGSTRPRTVLDVVMVSSVAAALAAFAIWFFAFAGSSLPS